MDGGWTDGSNSVRTDGTAPRLAGDEDAHSTERTAAREAVGTNDRIERRRAQLLPLRVPALHGLHPRRQMALGHDFVPRENRPVRLLLQPRRKLQEEKDAGTEHEHCGAGRRGGGRGGKETGCNNSPQRGEVYILVITFFFSRSILESRESRNRQSNKRKHQPSCAQRSRHVYNRIRHVGTQRYSKQAAAFLRAVRLLVQRREVVRMSGIYRLRAGCRNTTAAALHVRPLLWGAGEYERGLLRGESSSRRRCRRGFEFHHQTNTGSWQLSTIHATVASASSGPSPAVVRVRAALDNYLSRQACVLHYVALHTFTWFALAV